MKRIDAAIGVVLFFASAAGSAIDLDNDPWMPDEQRSANGGIVIRLLDQTYANPVNGEPLKVDIYRPLDFQRRFVEVWLHGGGMLAGAKGNWTAEACREAARNGHVCFDANYRLTPEGHRYPSQVYDVKALIRWIRANEDRFLLDGSKIAVNGHSAGGQLAMLLATTNGEAEWVTCDESPDSPYAFVAPATDCAGEPPAIATDADVQVGGGVATAVDMEANCELMAQPHGWYDQGWDRAWILDELPYLMPTAYSDWFPGGDCVLNEQLVEDFGPEGQGPGDIDPDQLAVWLEGSPLWRLQQGAEKIPVEFYVPLPRIAADGDGDGQPGVTIDGQIEFCLPGVNADLMVGLAGDDVPMPWGQVEASPGDPNPYTYDDGAEPCWGDTIRSDVQSLNYVTWANANGGQASIIGFVACPHTLTQTACFDGDPKGDDILRHWGEFLVENGF